MNGDFEQPVGYGLQAAVDEVVREWEKTDSTPRKSKITVKSKMMAKLRRNQENNRGR